MKKKDKMLKEAMHSAMEHAFYQQVDPRRRQEICTSRMIQEDPNAIANLPDRFINKTFNQHRFKYDQVSAGNPRARFSEVGE